MSSNKFTSGSRKRQAGFKSANNPSDAAILSLAVDSQSLFRRGVPSMLLRRENEPVDDGFQALFSEANRELASLLRDLRTESHRRSIGELLVKADQAMYEQKRRRSRLLLETATSTQSQ